MKKTLFILIISNILITQSYSQEIRLSTETNKLLIKEVVVLDSIKEDALYLIVKEWFIKTYVSSKDVIQLDDKEAGKIVGKGNRAIKTTVFGYLVSVYKLKLLINTRDWEHLSRKFIVS